MRKQSLQRATFSPIRLDSNTEKTLQQREAAVKNRKPKRFRMVGPAYTGIKEVRKMVELLSLKDSACNISFSKGLQSPPPKPVKRHYLLELPLRDKSSANVKLILY